MSAKTLYKKIVDTHTVKVIDENTVLLYCDMHFANEYTSPQAFAGLRQRKLNVFSPNSHLCVVDHIIPTHDESPRRIYDEASLNQAKTLQKNCSDFGIRAFYDANDPAQGIEHVIIEEQGLIRPGMVVICGDSHTTTHGALGALGFGIGTSEIEHILATQTLVYRLAGTMKIVINGEVKEPSTAKDLALYVLRKITARGALGLVVEYQGSAVKKLSIEERMTLCNLTVEAGARGAIIAPDEKTIDWVKSHAKHLTETDLAGMRAALTSFISDEDAFFDRSITLDANEVRPMVTWGTSPDQAITFSENIPLPSSFSDPIDQKAVERALQYQGLNGGEKNFKNSY